MKMAYPYSDVRRVVQLTKIVVAQSQGIAVDAAATAMGLAVGSANFKYMVLAARLLGLMVRREDRLIATPLGERFLKPPMSASDRNALMGRVPAFAEAIKSRVPADELDGTLVFSDVPDARRTKVMRFYVDLDSYLSSDRNVVGPAMSVSSSDDTDGALKGAMTEDGDIVCSSTGWLLADPALVALLDKAPKNGTSWSETRRENFLTCVQSLIRELLWET